MRKALPVIAVVLSLQSSCSQAPARPEVRTAFEESSGANVTAIAEPLVFVRGEPGLASSGRDYVYLAPLAVSRGGQRSCWLWLGLWSTIDRQARDADAASLSLGRLQILADGVPMDLIPEDAAGNPAGVTQLPYAAPVRPDRAYLVPVTRTQVARLGRAARLELIDQPEGGGSRRWTAAGESAGALDEFAGAIGAPR